MMLEKAWAKIKGNYELARGGFVSNGLRALIGSPVFRYRTSSLDADTVFDMLQSANSLNYIMGAGTIRTSSGSYLN